MYAFAIQMDVPGVVLLQPHDQPQQRGLAAPAGADDADELARQHLQIDVLEHLQRLAVDLVVLVQPTNLQGAGLAEGVGG